MRSTHLRRALAIAAAMGFAAVDADADVEADVDDDAARTGPVGAPAACAGVRLLASAGRMMTSMVVLAAMPADASVAASSVSVAPVSASASVMCWGAVPQWTARMARRSAMDVVASKASSTGAAPGSRNRTSMSRQVGMVDSRNNRLDNNTTWTVVVKLMMMKMMMMTRRMMMMMMMMMDGRAMKEKVGRCCVGFSASCAGLLDGAGAWRCTAGRRHGVECVLCAGRPRFVAACVVEQCTSREHYECVFVNDDELMIMMMMEMEIIR
jgi:hypothetical protein